MKIKITIKFILEKKGKIINFEKSKDIISFNFIYDKLFEKLFFYLI